MNKSKTNKIIGTNVSSDVHSHFFMTKSTMLVKFLRSNETDPLEYKMFLGGGGEGDK